MLAQPATRPRPFRRTISGACASLLLIACTGPVPSPSGPAPATGGTLRIGVPPGDAPFLEMIRSWLDPSGPPDAWFRRCCTARTLLSYEVAGSDGGGLEGGGAELVPDLATGLPNVSADGLSWTFHLRPGLHYAPPYEKVEIGAADIIRSIERISTEFPLLPAVEGLDEFVDDPSRGLAGLETPDALTLVVRLTRPDGDLPHRMALAATSPIPADALNDAGELTDFVSSGPYMVESAGGNEVVLVRNPSWSRSSDRLRPAHVDQIEIVPVTSEEAAQERVEAGTLDLITAYLTPRDYRGVLRSGDVEQILTAQDNAIFQIPMNVANPPLDDVHVRRAVALLLDRRAIAERLEGRGSLFQVADHILPEIVVNGLLSDYDPLAAAGESGNLAAAQAEMRQSRYDTDRDGRCDQPACDRLVLLVFFDPGTAAESVAEQLPALGMTPVIKGIRRLPPDPATYHMVAVAGWGAFGPMPSEYGVLWSSDGIPGGANLTLVGASRNDVRRWGFGGNVPSLDMQTQFCAEHAGSSAFRCWAELDQLVMEQVVAFVPIGTRLLAYRISDRVTAVEMSPTEAIPALDTIQVQDDAPPTG